MPTFVIARVVVVPCISFDGEAGILPTDNNDILPTISHGRSCTIKELNVFSFQLRQAIALCTDCRILSSVWDSPWCRTNQKHEGLPSVTYKLGYISFLLWRDMKIFSGNLLNVTR
jgi:hypothetical protein